MKLIDKISGPMRAITKAMDSTLVAMRSIEGIELGSEFAQAAADVKLAENAVNDLNGDLNDFGENDALSKQGKNSLEFNAALEIANKGIQLIKNGINEIGKLTALSDMQTQAETSLAVVLKNQGAGLEDFNRIVSEAAAMQNEITISSSAMTKGMAELATYIGDTDALMALMPTFADFAIGMNEGAPELGESAAVQYATALGKALDGQYEGLTKKGFTVTEAQKKIIEQGSEMERVAVITEIIGASWDGMAEAIARTPLGQITMLKNETDSLKAAIGEGLYPYLLEFQQFLSSVLNPVLEFIAENMDTIIPIVEALGVAFLAVALAVGIYTAAQWIATGAAQAFFSTLLSNPLTWIVLLVGAIVFAIARWVQAVGGIEIAWIKAMDGIYNATSYIKQGVMVLLEDLVNGAIDIINDFISVLNLIPGVEIELVKRVTFGAETAAAEEAKRTARAESSTARIAEILASQEQADQISLQESIFDSVGGVESALEDVTTGSGSGSALKTTGEVTFSDEDIQLLLDLAGMEYQITYQVLEPQIALNIDTIRETADIDEVLDRVGEAVAEMADASLVYG